MLSCRWHHANSAGFRRPPTSPLRPGARSTCTLTCTTTSALRVEPSPLATLYNVNGHFLSVRTRSTCTANASGDDDIGIQATDLLRTGALARFSQRRKRPNSRVAAVSAIWPLTTSSRPPCCDHGIRAKDKNGRSFLMSARLTSDS